MSDHLDSVKRSDHTDYWVIDGRYYYLQRTSPCHCRHPRHVVINEPGNGLYTVCATCHGQVCDAE